MRQFLILFFLIIWQNTFAQIIVQAHVQDAETGEALPYVNVYVSEEQGTITNNEGDFKIVVKEDATLKITSIGYEGVALRSSSIPKTIKLKPIASTMAEVTVVPAEKILLKVRDKLYEEYQQKAARESDFFYRLSIQHSGRNELIEAFTRANSDVQLRYFSFLCGRRGRLVDNRLGPSQLSDVNLYHLVELAPMILKTNFWEDLIAPLPISQEIGWFRKLFDITCSVIKNKSGQIIYAIHLNLKNSEQTGILSGTLYVDSDHYHLLRFDGEVSGYALDVNKELQRTSGDATISVHISYTRRNNFTEVNTLTSEVKIEDLTCHTTLYNVSPLHIKLKHCTPKYGVIRDSLNVAEFDKTYQKLAGVVQQTSVESNLAKSLLLARKVEKRDSLGGFKNVIERLTAFGKTIPQEKVYIHMDNNCYFVGDTIWFSAYTRSTLDDKPSNVSGVLYVELLNNDGYVIERKLLNLHNGCGDGFFALSNDIQYAGFYELRAYTRWQLNWGGYVRKHSLESRKYFKSDIAERQYFRDYQKLYSRVFPVYDKPSSSGAFYRDMTLRAMRRNFKKEPDEPTLTLSFFPEGGHLVKGVPNRVAFEAKWSNGKWGDGWLHMGTDSVHTYNRGRGIITVQPNKEQTSNIVFRNSDGNFVKATLPSAETDGVALHIALNGKQWDIQTFVQGDISPDSLALSIMHEGKLESVQYFSNRDFSTSFEPKPDAQGIYQATVFDVQGRVYADRLFFVTSSQINTPTLSIKNVKPEYKPYEPISLKLVSAQKSQQQVSLSVKDAGSEDLLFDNGTILTEMLLASELRGFIPNPGWFFEKDDEEHLQALDLLMLTQGWRRFNWRDMAVKGEWEFTQPDEKVPVISGYFTKTTDEAYNASLDELDEQERMVADSMYLSTDIPERGAKTDNECMRIKPAIGQDVLLHTELIDLDGQHPVVYETTSNTGFFNIHLPSFQGKKVLFLSADSSSKHKDKKKDFTWIQMQEDPDDLPIHHASRYQVQPLDYFVNVILPFPHFAKPFDFYQNHIAGFGGTDYMNGDLLADSVHSLREIKVTAKHRSYNRFRDNAPAIMMDAYEAENFAMDCGLGNSFFGIARAFVGDMGQRLPYVTDEYGLKDFRIRERYGLGPTMRHLPQFIDLPLDSIYHPKYLSTNGYNPRNTSFWREVRGGLTMSPDIAKDYDNICKIDKIFLYTDYCPRLIGSKRYSGSNLPETDIAIYPYYDGSRRVIYRDRRYVIDGFAYPAQFYSPDYSKQSLPETPDYRRTLYWNPNLQLDENGEARVTFYNNSIITHLSVEAEGQASDGTLLWGNSSN